MYIHVHMAYTHNVCMLTNMYLSGRSHDTRYVTVTDTARRYVCGRCWRYRTYVLFVLVLSAADNIQWNLFIKTTYRTSIRWSL